jgi:hypothetical protein
MREDMLTGFVESYLRPSLETFERVSSTLRCWWWRWDDSDHCQWKVDERVKVKYARGVVRVGCPGNERKTKTAVMRQAAGLPVGAI